MAEGTPGQTALALIDQVLAERPVKNDHALSHATASLAAFRDRLVVERRRGSFGPAQAKQLDHVNAVITIVLGTHFPLGDVPWHELEKARGWLAGVVDTGAVAA